MDRNEQDILNKIDEKTKDAEVPESIKPENIISLLENEEAGAKNKTKVTRITKVLGLAAVFCVLILGAWGITGLNKGRGHIDRGKATNTAAQKSGNVQVAKSYEELYSYMEREEKVLENARGAAAQSAKSDVVTQESGNATASPASTDNYSETNVRQEGVDEADVVKTDGKFLYVMKDNRTEIAVVEPNDGKMKSRGMIKCEEGFIEEFYLNKEKNKLVVICSISGTNGAVMPLSDMSHNGVQTTKAITYDLTDIDNPKNMGEISQSGSYTSSRMSGDYVYLFTTYYVGSQLARSDKSTYVPSVNGEVIAKEKIYLPIEEANSYVVISSANIEKPGETTDSKAIISKGGELYVSDQNIYLYEMGGWMQNETPTPICKVSYKDGKLEAIARTEIKGYINDSFSIDEYEGNLRIVATVGKSNSVYILDKELNTISTIEDLAKGERVYSARLMGDVGYFVTYKETDPLFSVDLSNPKAPKILGALKIPGFSEYLHPYGENKLLGIGMDVDEKTMVSGGAKLSMFDVTDKTDVKELNTFILENVYSTDVSYSYKAATIDVEENLIGFAGYVEGGQSYYLFAYDEELGFQKLMEEAIHGNTMVSPRGIFIENVLYVVEGSVVESYSLQNYKKIEDIIL